MTTTKNITDSAYYAARQLGLSTRAARAIAEAVAQRVVLGGETPELAQADEVARAAARAAKGDR